MNFNKIWICTLMLSVMLADNVFAQSSTGGGSAVGDEYRTITTAVPFMRISPDARSGGMGDVGIALSPDANASYWNIGKLAMSNKELGASLAYTPWLRDLVPDISLVNFNGYFKFGEEDNKNQAVTFGLHYFSLGNIQFTDINAQNLNVGQPREYSVFAGYSRKLSDHFSLGLTGKFIHSDLLNGTSNAGVNNTPGNTFAVDFGTFYTTRIGPDMGEGLGSRLNLGLAVTNLGAKISYSTARQDFLPTNLGLGAAYEYYIDEYNKLTFALDLNKLLVPSPQIVLDSANNNAPILVYPTDKTVLSGALGSFGDAPDGGSEELKEVQMSFGAEYGYQDQFFARAGYFYEAELKGDRRYFSLGLGVKYNVFGLDFAYLVPSGSGVNRNPLSNTLRFTLLFDFDNLGEIVKGKPKKEDKNSRDSKDDE